MSGFFTWTRAACLLGFKGRVVAVSPAGTPESRVFLFGGYPEFCIEPSDLLLAQEGI
jgi:hypothetical protein